MTHNRKRLCLIIDIMVLIGISAFIVWLIVHTPRQSCAPERGVYPVKGIDISAHNGDIDFSLLAADTVSFVMIKATEGISFCDAKFHSNYEKARAAGLKVGAYHFFRFDSPGDLQAAHFLASMDSCIFDLPLTIDVEKWGNPSDYDTDEVVYNLRQMLHTIRRAGYPVMIYTNKRGHADFIADNLTDMVPEDIPLWICSLSAPPTIQKWDIWQHSHSGKVKGISTVVDLNTYNGSREEFLQWLHPFTVSHAQSM